MKSVIIIGGGLAGLLSAIQLTKAGISCTVIEKKTYPFHRVCGEYISNETVPFLKSLDLFPAHLKPSMISRFMLSSTKGKSETMPLDLGGFGISRYSFDFFLYEKAKELGAEFLLDTEAENVEFFSQTFQVSTQKKIREADLVLGAFGKRSRVDIQLNRNFIQKRSPYAGVKYHIKTQHPGDLIALHNFEGGYCGISNVENGITNLCYLIHRDKLKMFKNIRETEEHVLFRNPLLKEIFRNADFLFEKPEVINEISFETKRPVENHVLMIGDAAGMITPLCGNGMAMAIHSSKIANELIVQFFSDKNFSRDKLELAYSREWRKLFAKRLWVGRQIQKLFGSKTASNMAINMALYFRPLANIIIRNTHGKTF